MARFLVAPALALGLFALVGVRESAAQQATAGAPPAPAASTSTTAEPDIVVVGQRTHEAIQNFVRQMQVVPRNVNQLGRWDRRICAGVAGLRTRYAQFLIDRVAQRAIDVGLDIGEPGCSANVLIIVSADPDATAHELVDRNPQLMGYFNDLQHRAPNRHALAAFQTSTLPVRSWHVNRTVSRDGDPLATGDYNMITGGASRLRATTRQDFGVAFVIVDARRLAGINFDWGALADYLAMVTLAQLDPGADTAAYPTILNLFSTASAQSARPTALTDWDVAYLHGLYGATRDARSAAHQEGEIAHSMDQALSPH